MSALKLYEKYVSKYGERLKLFELLAHYFEIKSALYPGSALHVTPSFFFPLTVYIDTYSKAKIFFKKNIIDDVISARKIYLEKPIVRFYPTDFRKETNERENSFDLLISLYAGFVSKYCKRYLKIGGILIVNNSHGDASMASIDADYEFIGTIHLRNRKYYFSQKNLDQYFIPKKEVIVTEEYLEKIQHGIGYKKSASIYLFKRTN